MSRHKLFGILAFLGFISGVMLVGGCIVGMILSPLYIPIWFLIWIGITYGWILVFGLGWAFTDD